MIQNGLVYEYDASFDGLLTCIFCAFEQKQDPLDIVSDSETFFEVTRIETDDRKAERVKKGIRKALGEEFYYMIQSAYLSREKGSELKILRFIREGYKLGGNVLKNLDNPIIFEMFRLSKSVGREAHRIIEFLRFSDYNGNLISVVNPKHFILPLIKKHFESRFPNENFFIYDEVHCAALAKIGKEIAIIPVESYEMPPLTADEEKFRELWQLFYDTIEIKERRNLKLRMQHLPKRFWKNVTELSKELG